MRKIILFMVLSLDGYVDSAKGGLDWENQDPEIGMDMIPDLLKTVDSMILGRVLYEGFMQAWPAMAKDPNSPKELVEFANWVVDSPKYVVSKSLKKVDGKNARLISVKNDDDVIREVKKLKKEAGGDIVVFGGVRLSQTLVRLGLVDEYRFKLQPVVLGDGKPLFKDLENKIKLELKKSKKYDAGVVSLYYKPA
jgi:dihydrofolate reductase